VFRNGIFGDRVLEMSMKECKRSCKGKEIYVFMVYVQAAAVDVCCGEASQAHTFRIRLSASRLRLLNRVATMQHQDPWHFARPH
jgi:hypothetical protein